MGLQEQPRTPNYERDLRHTFGEHAGRLLLHISTSNPALSSDEVLIHAWSMIPEATAYMMPATTVDLTEQAIRTYEQYEAIRKAK